MFPFASRLAARRVPSKTVMAFLFRVLCRKFESNILVVTLLLVILVLFKRRR